MKAIKLVSIIPQQPHAGSAILETLKSELGLLTDSDLSSVLEVSGSTISKIKSGKLRVSDDVLLKVHEATEIPIHRLKSMIYIQE